MREAKPFGWEVTVEFWGTTALKTFHWRGCSEHRARSNGMLKPRARRIVCVTPVSEAEWLRAYGIGRM
jgi:hypothetical protein